jgi:hypothetical protein
MSLATLLLFTVSAAYAVTPEAVQLTVESKTVDATASSTVTVKVTADKVGEIAGAAFTLRYDTANLVLDSVASDFFDTFANQFAAVSAPAGTETSVDVGGTTYDAPLVENTRDEFGTLVAAARVQADAAETNKTLFTFTFNVSGAINGVYGIRLERSVIDNAAAGYNPDGEAIPVLIGALLDEPDLTKAFPVIPVSRVVQGAIEVTGGSAGLSIEGKVTKNDIGVPGAFVEALSESTGKWAGAEADAEGNYKIEGLVAASDYRVWTHIGDEEVAVEDVTASATGVNLTLTTAPSAYNKEISGVVKFGAEVVPGAWVRVSSASTGVERFVIADVNGEFTITGLPAASDFVLDIMSDKGDITMTGVSSTDTGGAAVDVVLETVVASISGEISGIDAGWTIYVDVWSRLTGENGGTSIVTTGAGPHAYSVDNLNDDVTDFIVWVYGENPTTGKEIAPVYYVGGVAAGTTKWSEATLVDVSDGTADDAIDITLSTGRSISGTVTFADEELPAERVLVEAWSMSTGLWQPGFTDENGDYTIEGLVASDDYEVSVRVPGYPETFYLSATESTESRKDATMVDLSTASQENIDLFLTRGGSITGSVKNHDNDQPIADAWVDVYSPTEEIGGGGFTDAQGGFEVENLKRGVTDYEVTVFPGDGFTPETQTGKKVGDVVDFRLTRGFTLYGALSGGYSDAGDSSARAAVIVWNADFFAEAVPSTTDGTFQIEGLITGDYQIAIWPVAGYAKFRGTLSDLNEESSTSAAPKTFTIEGSAVDISGKVLDGSGDPLRVFVDAWSDDAGFGASVMTRPDGTYTIRGLLPNNTYTVSVFSRDYEAAEQEVTVTTADVADVDFTLTAETGGSITGTVMVGSTPVVDAWVEAYSVANPTEWAGALTGTDGSFSLTGLDNTFTDYKVTVYPDAYAPMSETGKSVGDTVAFALTAGSEIGGTVTASGTTTPLSGVTVKLFFQPGVPGEPAGWTGKTVLTGADGTYLFQGLESGTYTLRAVYGTERVWYDGSGGDNTGTSRPTTGAGVLDTTNTNDAVDFSMSTD